MLVYKTKKDSDFNLTKADPIFISKASDYIKINKMIKKQQIIGFGGAFTEASAYNLSRVDKSVREKAIKLYFGKEEGIGYNIGRAAIHGCDFSLGSYLYIDDYDDSLESFTIERDKRVIELINDAKRVSGEDIEILSSPWTPPFWMKDNNSPVRGGHLKKEYYSVWADYFVKYIESYRSKGINIRYVTIQNEPAALQRWDSCLYTPEEEGEFVKVLGKTLEDNGLSDVKILIWDHNRDIMVDRVKNTIFDDVVDKYTWGIAFHWYDNDKFAEVKKTHDLFPSKHLIFTEGCQENGPHFGDHAVGERYGLNMIKDLRNYTEGYLDWNLFLDETGGPNHVNNLCSAPIIIKIFPEEIVKMPAYYYIGHFSKFIKRGAYQIESSGTEKLDYVSFINPDGKTVTVIMNRSEDDIDLTLEGFGKDYKIRIEKRSIQTIII